MKSVMLLTDPEAGKCVSLGVWDTEADLASFEGSEYYLEQIGKVKPFLACPPTREGWDVGGQA